MKSILTFFACCSLLVNSPAWSQDDHEQHANLNFFVTSPTYPPFIYLTHDNQAAGLVPDLLNQVAAEQGSKVVYSIYNRYRAEEALYSGEADAIILVKEWTASPEQLIFSQPLVEVAEYLYQSTPFEPDMSLPDLIDEKIICARRGYAYPQLDNLFAQNIATRVDTSSEITQFKMLIRNRCQLAIADNYTAHWIQQQYGWEQQITQALPISSNTPYTVAFTKDNREFAEKFDKLIGKMKESGELTFLMQKHLSTPMNTVALLPSFP